MRQQQTAFRAIATTVSAVGVPLVTLLGSLSMLYSGIAQTPMTPHPTTLKPL